ncbi:Pectinesterase inhibitor domain containing protein [Rhynchospora pubera]|uniref:Pectinesterase inhibitor domain containing protein n=1 Tax=Rhynchospora pubera TaxID=906938 RepID=A0AAV8DLS9_9POAL|nr:Pectinesterase inhibitor domain containing protein [Rhynchospora pubera]KAJ4797757.1 Pectinesterase inhibitor domain containing protein [Rhynchospora pubera]
MAGQPAAVVFLVLFALVATGESRLMRHTNRIALFNPTTMCKDDIQYQKICLKVAKASGATSPNALVQANVEAAITTTQQAAIQVGKLMNSSSQDYQGIMGSALHACQESYDSLLDALHQSQVLLQTRGSHDDLMTQLSAASTHVTTCTDSVGEVPEASYPPEKVHSLLGKLVSNTLDLGAKLNAHNEKH